MNETGIKLFKLIGRVQNTVAKAETLEEALEGGISGILEDSNADSAVVWYKDKSGDGKLHPYFFICPIDFTSRVYDVGEGIVGTVFAQQKSIRMLDYKHGDDRQVDRDFEGMNICSMVCTPLSNKYEDLGCIQFLSSDPDKKISEEEADICEMMAMMIAISIDENEKLQEPWREGKIILSARNITKTFKNGDIVTNVLKGVNLDVYEGELLVVLGESGCGKSTFLNIISGMDQASSGSLNYLGNDYSNASQEELTLFRRKNIGFIFQSYNLMPNLNAKQNLELIGELVENPMSAKEALKLVGLQDRLKSYPSQLSGGQQQRVSIARAIIKRPKLIMADEPTAALDYATSIEVLQVLENIVKAGATLIMVTHNEEITRMANRVVRMRDGRTYEVVVNRHPVPAGELIW